MVCVRIERGYMYGEVCGPQKVIYGKCILHHCCLLYECQQKMLGARALLNSMFSPPSSFFDCCCLLALALGCIHFSSSYLFPILYCSNLKLGPGVRFDALEKSASLNKLRRIHSKMLMDIQKVQSHYGGAARVNAQMIRDALQSQYLGSSPFGKRQGLRDKANCSSCQTEIQKTKQGSDQSVILVLHSGKQKIIGALLCLSLALYGEQQTEHYYSFLPTYSQAYLTPIPNLPGKQREQEIIKAAH